MDDMYKNQAIKIFNAQFSQTPKSIRRLHGGITNYMFELENELGNFILRVYPQNKDKAGYYEKDIIEKLKSFSCPVPTVIAHEMKGENGSYLLYKKIEGQNLKSVVNSFTSKQMQSLSDEVLDYLIQLKKISIQGSGSIVSLEKAEEESATIFWQKALKKCINTAKETNVVSSEVIKSLELIQDKYHDIHFDNALGWGDLSLSNLIITPNNKLAGIIDFESYFAMDTSLTLGYLQALHPNDELLNCLIERSQNDTNLNINQEKIDLMSILRLMRIIPHAHKPLPNGQAQKSLSEFLPGSFQALNRLAPSMNKSYKV